MKSGELRDLKARTAAARKAADDADAAAGKAKKTARDLAEKAIALEAELDLELWVKAQVDELGVDEAMIDRRNRVVMGLEAGPTYDERPGQ